MLRRLLPQTFHSRAVKKIVAGREVNVRKVPMENHAEIRAKHLKRGMRWMAYLIPFPFISLYYYKPNGLLSENPDRER